MSPYPCYRFVRRCAAAALAASAVLTAPCAYADQGADLAIRLLQGVLGAAQQANAPGGGFRGSSRADIPVANRAPVYPSTQAWMQAVREDGWKGLRGDKPRPDALVADVWLMLNTPQPVTGWPRDNVDIASFRQVVTYSLDGVDEVIAGLLTERPPSFMVSSTERGKQRLKMVFGQLGNQSDLSGCRAGNQSCSEKLLAFFQQYVDTGLQGAEEERQRRVADWKRQEQARLQAEQQKQALVDAAEQERKAGEAERIRIEAERVRAEEERRARQRASRVGG